MASPTKSSTGTISWCCRCETGPIRGPALRGRPGSVTLLPHELVVDRRGESPLRRASAVDEEREVGEAGSPRPQRPRIPDPAGRAAGGRRGLTPPERRGLHSPAMSGVSELGRRAQAAARVLGSASTAERNAALLAAADLLVDRTDDLLAANRVDVESAEAGGMEPGPLDRLRLTDARIASMADGLRRSPRCPTPSARSSTAGADPTACASNSVGCPSVWSRSSTRTGPTSPVTPPASA